MDAAERERRRELIADEIRERAGDNGAPLPAFLNVVTDKIVDLQSEIEELHRTVNRLNARTLGGKW